MADLTSSEKLNLEKMIKASDAEDNTDKIRELKHSKLIENDIQQLLMLKSKYKRLSETNIDQFDKMCENKCSFIFTNYTQIYNKVKKDNINLNLLAHFLVILKKIENKEINQHEGSVMVGKVLKEIYVDSALREGQKIDQKNKKNKSKEAKKPSGVVKNISYKEYKLQNN
tara:strand:+ start:57 stop:566 length:510 start_codon:yes stop_codon:yes gene_type:complete